MNDCHRLGRQLTLDEAAGRLGVETAAARMFVRLKLLRTAPDQPLAVWELDVERLRRVLARQQRAESWVGA
jgi:hypothetical protein